ncbi:MAG TPA: hypothetical protein VF599_02610 [Pyrinomonadaceae bacterium]|jgi:hypothetical protein
MASNKGLSALIEPSEVLLWAGQSTSFILKVNKKQVPASWTLSVPEIGKINSKTGNFKAEDKLTYGKATVTAIANVDGQMVKATATIRIMMGIGLMHTEMYFTDDLLKIPTISWNNPIGRRAAKLIIDAIYQLPPKFLEKVGTVALVRADWLKPPTSGMHLPLPGRVVILSEYMFQELNKDAKNGRLPPGITPEDKAFVRNFIHEIAHAVLANDGLSNFARWSLITLAAVGLAGGIYSGIKVGGAAAGVLAGWGAVPIAAGTGGVAAGIIIGGTVMVVADYAMLLSAYYGNPWRQEDLAYRFSKETGWEVRDPNPLALFWGGMVPPNVITGFRFVGPLVGLRNKYAPKGNNPADWRKAGFYDDYSGDDVHEHFAETVATIAMNFPTDQSLLSRKLFQKARDLLVTEEIFPWNWQGIEVGKIALEFSQKKGKPANFEDFGVFFGLYAGGAGPKGGKAVVKPAPPKKKVATKGVRNKERVEIFSAEENEKTAFAVSTSTPSANDDSSALNDESGNDNGEGLFAEGYGKRWDEDEVAETQQLVENLGELGKAVQRFRKETAPVLDEVRQTIESLPFPLREGSLIELLRSAECHGLGLQRIGSEPVPFVSPVIENGMQKGDMLVDKRNNLWIVTRVENGVAAEIVGIPRLNERGRVEKGFDPADLLYYWRPTSVPRVWFDGQTEKEAEAFVKIVRLWGREMTEDDEYSLFKAGSFMTVILKIFGKRVRDLAGGDDETVLEYCTSKGGLLNWKAEMELKLRDAVRLRGGKWAFVLRTKPLDLIVQGKTEGEINEEEDSAKILHDASAEKITHVWRWQEHPIK